MAAMPHTIELSPEISSKIDDMIAQGRFSNIQEAVAYSIDLSHQESTDLSQYSASALARIDEGVAASLRGEVVSQEEVEAFFDDWRSELSQ